MPSTDHQNFLAKIKKLEADIKRLAPQAKVSGELVERALAERDYFLILEELVPRLSGVPAATWQELRPALEEMLRIKTYSHPRRVKPGKPKPVVFGTAGHRGEIGVGLTLAHIHAIITAFIQMVEEMAPHDRAHHFTSADLDHVKEMGILIGHDNRLFNPAFSAYAGHLLANAGWRVLYGGRVSTPELSRVVPYGGYAGAVNFTPSHNPFRYGGIKLNPADGGLAGPDLTDPLAKRANQILDKLEAADWPSFDELDATLSDRLAQMELVDVHAAYLECLEAHPVVRLKELCQQVKTLGEQGKLLFAVDPTWGAAVPIYQRLAQRMGAGMALIHTEEDPYFGGQTTEPNEQTLSDALAKLKASGATHQVAVRNDPDSDRAIVGDQGGAIKMNRFAALVMRYLMEQGHGGGLATTWPTSQFGPVYAKAHGRQVVLTPTGFKNFRQLLAGGDTLVAYEESDGLSIHGHTLDKDGVLAGLMALRITLHYGRPLSTLLEEMEAEHGKFYWLQDTFMIDIPAAEAAVKLRSLADIQVGASIDHNGKPLAVAHVNSDDGYRFQFADGSWVMMRPSGTEPKIRVYAETTVSPQATQALCALGKQMAQKAIAG